MLVHERLAWARTGEMPVPLIIISWQPGIKGPANPAIKVILSVDFGKGEGRGTEFPFPECGGAIRRFGPWPTEAEQLELGSTAGGGIAGPGGRVMAPATGD